MKTDSLHTRRLHLEPLRACHAQDMFEGLQDETIYTFIPEDPPVSCEALRKKYVRLEQGPGDAQEEKWFNWIIWLNDSLCAGYVQATLFGDGTASLAYVIFSKYWRQGIAKEACRCIISLLFTDHGVHLITANVDVENAGSIALLRSLGFANMKRIPHADVIRGMPRDEFEFALHKNGIKTPEQPVPSLDKKMSIAGFLDDCAKNLNPTERRTLRKMLGVAIPKLVPNSCMPDGSRDLEKFAAVCSALRSYQDFAARIPENGIVFHGRPDWLNDELLGEFQAEAVRVRVVAVKREGHFLGKGGTLADQFASSEELLRWVRSFAGHCKPSGIASYIYYDFEGQGLFPHIDTDIFAINVLIMLNHTFPADGECSMTCIFPGGRRMEKYSLNPGETMIMFGGSVVHSRSPVRQNEVVHVLTFGFQPV